MTFEKVKQFIDKNPHLLVISNGIPATDDMVKKIETELDIKLCGEYLRFIQKWGSISLVGSYWDYHALYHFAYAGKDIYWVVNNTKSCRDKGLPHNYVPIVSMDGDAYYCLEPSVDGNQAVYAWDFFANEFYRKESDSLFEFIWRDITEHVIPNAIKDALELHLD